MNIKFFCRSFDLRLYEKSRLFYASLGYPCVRLTDQTADGYFYTMLRDTDCDIAINVDEDCFIADPKAVLELVDYVAQNDYANAGCPDGGGATPRNANPIVTNPFFNIFNLQLIREKAGDAGAIRKAVRHFDYRGQHLHEPYYPFFFWLAANFRTLYLPSKKHSDGWTTILYDQQGRLLCQHSWLSRFYSVPAFIIHHWQKTAGAQKDRIDSLIAETAAMRGLTVPAESFSDTLRYALDKTIRWSIKVPQRIANWPHKLRLKLGL